MSAIATPLLWIVLWIVLAAVTVVIVAIFRRSARKGKDAYVPDDVVLPPGRGDEPWRSSIIEPAADYGAEGHVRPFPRPYEPPPPPLFDLSSYDFEEAPAYVPPPPPVPPEGSIAIDDPAVVAGAVIGCQTENGTTYRLTLVDLAEKHFMMTRRWTEDGIRKSKTMKVLFCGCADGHRYFDGHVAIGGKMRLYEVLPDGTTEEASSRLFTSRIVRCFLDVPDAAESRSA